MARQRSARCYPTRSSTARSHRNLAQCLHDHDLDGSPTLLLLEIDLRYHGAFPAGYVPGRDTIERKGQYVLPAEIAATECGKVGPQSVVGGYDVILDQVLDHSTANAGVTTVPVNVDPVVPVRRTV
jgi:hypothetical protein